MKRLRLLTMVLLAGLFVATSGTYLAPSSAFVTHSQTERKEVKVWVNQQRCLPLPRLVVVREYE